MHGHKTQSPIEYLTTYGWAVLILAVVLAAAYEFGVFSPASYVRDSCIMPAGFDCSASVLSENGILFVNIEQSMSVPINVTGIACSTNRSAAIMTAVSPAVHLDTGGNTTFTVPCYSNHTVFFGGIGSIYHGYLTINYTDEQSGFPHAETGYLVLKAQSPGP